MAKIIEILLERGGMLGVVVLALGWTVIHLYRDKERDRLLHQQVMAVKEAASDATETRLQQEKEALHERHKEDQRKATNMILELSDRVHQAVDRVSDLLEHSHATLPQQRPPPTPHSTQYRTESSTHYRMATESPQKTGKRTQE